MTKAKVQNNRHQVKLTFGEVPEGSFDVERLVEELGLELQALTTSAGVLIMSTIMEQERDHLTGERYGRRTTVGRWGTQEGYVVLGGQKAAVAHPRVRDKNGKEVRLSSYERFQDAGQRTQGVFQRLVSGLSCRNYPQAIETLREGYGLRPRRGVSKSVVNREMVDATSKQLKELCERDLSEFSLCAHIIDGVKLGDSVYIVALGVETTGKKAIMGFREGSTENADVCVALLEDMVRRGLATDRPVLVVIDGSKALRSAADKFFGDRASVQRCQVHKRRNVKKHLPDKYHAEYDRKMLAEDAAGSLREGMEETLTLHRLEIPGLLRISFSSTPRLL